MSDQPRSSGAVSAGYPTGCAACGAGVGQPCRTKSGRVTDTHRARIDAQFQKEDVR